MSIRHKIFYVMVKVEWPHTYIVYILYIVFIVYILNILYLVYSGSICYHHLFYR